MQPNTQSTGPRTERGKQRSSLNALRHGLTGQTVVIPSDDRRAYHAFGREFFQEFQPATPLERQLVQTISDCSWRLNRLRAQEQTLLSLSTVECESQVNTADDRAAAACASALAFEKNSRLLANLSIYEQRISREFDRALKQLDERQATRHRIEEQQIARAATLKARHDELQAKRPQQLPYIPSEDGFVFANGAIETWAARQDRYSDADDARRRRGRAHAA
jgi:hypothetical protein